MPASPTTPLVVETAAGLHEAVSSGAKAIHIAARIGDLPPILLQPGQMVRGLTEDATLVFKGDGLVLSANNSIGGLSILSPNACRALLLGDGPEDRGELRLSGLVCKGQIQLIFPGETTAAHLWLQGIAIAGADSRSRPERPHANGVDVLQGAITIWNRATRPITIPAAIDGIEIGSAGRPVTGSGLFIAGHGGGTGGRIAMDALRVGPVHADSGLAPGTTDTVAGGVFILQDATVGTITGSGSVITHGPNAVPIDNWGSVDLWRLDGDAISHGPSAIGFINAGTLQRLEVTGIIETFGDGARGCGIYGPTGSVSAHMIRTHGDAAIGVQIISTLDRLTVTEGIFTEGQPGAGLVKGVMVETPAHAIHIEHGGALGEMSIGRIEAAGRNAMDLCNEGRARADQA